MLAECFSNAITTEACPRLAAIILSTHDQYGTIKYKGSMTERRGLSSTVAYNGVQPLLETCSMSSPALRASCDVRQTLECW